VKAIMFVTTILVATAGTAGAAPPTDSVASYEVVIRECICSPFNASEATDIRILVSRSPITLPPIGSFVYVASGLGPQRDALVVWRLTTDFASNAGGTVTYRTIVETAPQDVLQAANPNLPALGLTSFTIAGPPP
jgi:hypothetical protein